MTQYERDGGLMVA